MSRWARDMRKPVLIHVLTKKGKGCPYAEANPELYHGVGPFDPETGVLVPEKEGFAARFGALLCRYAESDPKIAAITAAMSGGTGLEGFAARFPERFYDIGIAEEHAVSMAGGMAKQGQLPVFAVYSSFLQRAFDMLIHDISLQDLHAVFAVDRSGLVGRDGETHQGSFDVSFLSTVPGMTIYAPASFSELDAMLGLALYGCDGPVAIRYPRGGEGAYHDCHTEAEFVLREGSDLTIVSYGVMINEALEAADRLAEDGIMAEVIKIGRIRPNSFDETRLSVGKTKRLVVAEDVCAFGSVGSQILSSLAGVTEGFDYRLLNLGDGIVQHGSVEELRRMRGIDAQGIVRAARTLFSEE